MIEKQHITLDDCPFCAHVLSPKCPETLHPSGVYWHYDENSGSRVYYSREDINSESNACWQVNCEASFGGCGATISADSIEDVIKKWNRRDSKKPVLVDPRSSKENSPTSKLSFKMFAHMAVYKGCKVFLNVGSKDFTSSHQSGCPIVPVIVVENNEGEYYGFISSDGELSMVCKGLNAFNCAECNPRVEKNEGIVLRLSIEDSPMCQVCEEHAIGWDLKDLKRGRRQVGEIVEYHCRAASLED